MNAGNSQIKIKDEAEAEVSKSPKKKEPGSGPQQQPNSQISVQGNPPANSSEAPASKKPGIGKKKKILMSFIGDQEKDTKKSEEQTSQEVKNSEQPAPSTNTKQGQNSFIMTRSKNRMHPAPRDTSDQ